MNINCKIARVRYNTESNGKELLWRLVLDGKEYLVNNIRIEKACATTTDWLEDKQCFKHHLSVTDCTAHIDGETLEAVLK